MLCWKGACIYCQYDEYENKICDLDKEPCEEYQECGYISCRHGCENCRKYCDSFDTCTET